jgi:hypothetical protein
LYAIGSCSECVQRLRQKRSRPYFDALLRRRDEHRDLAASPGRQLLAWRVQHL